MVGQPLPENHNELPAGIRGIPLTRKIESKFRFSLPHGLGLNYNKSSAKFVVIKVAAIDTVLVT